MLVFLIKNLQIYENRLLMTKNQKVKCSKAYYKFRNINLRFREIENTRSIMRMKNRLSCISITRMIKFLNSDAAKFRIAPTLNASCYPTSDFIPCASTGVAPLYPIMELPPQGGFNPLIAEPPTRFPSLLLAMYFLRSA